MNSGCQKVSKAIGRHHVKNQKKTYHPPSRLHQQQLTSLHYLYIKNVELNNFNKRSRMLTLSVWEPFHTSQSDALKELTYF